MLSRLKLLSFIILNFFAVKTALAQQSKTAIAMKLNSQEYLEYQRVNVMLAHDFYLEGYQDSVGIIQNGQCVEGKEPVLAKQFLIKSNKNYA